MDLGPIREYNHVHRPSGPGGGQFASSTGAGLGQVPVVDDITEAVSRILQGKDVVLRDVKSVHTLIKRLGAMAVEAKRLGEKAPDYDLCKVSVKGTNLFCADRVKNKEYPDGIPRVEMPQLVGYPVPGSEADSWPKNDRGRINGADQFIAYMKAQGYETTTQTIAASRLRASQKNLVGKEVADMMTGERPLSDKPIFVSSDKYIVDGHHRWAALVGLDAADGKLGDTKMQTFRINAPISTVLRLAKAWTKKVGIQNFAGVDKTPLREFNMHHDPKTGEFTTGGDVASTLDHFPKAGETYTFSTHQMSPFQADVLSSEEYATHMGDTAAARAVKAKDIMIRHHVQGSSPYYTTVNRKTWAHWHGAGNVPIPN